MFRRLFGESETTSVASTSDLQTVEKLLKLGSNEERGLFVLKHLAITIGGDIRGSIVRGNDREGFHFEVIQGYPPNLLDITPEHGPWRDLRPRIINNLIAELLTPNTKEVREQLGAVGLRNAKASMLIPISSPTYSYGAMLLHQHAEDSPFDDEDLKLASNWGSILGNAQSVYTELLQTRRSLIEFTKAFVEAIEAQDFTQLGHASRVTAYALAMGRALEFSRQELIDLYFASMLHDVGKLGSGMELSVEDSNHPLRGANLVASSPLLSKATEGIKAHHEHWDGSGFPNGLRKDEIPKAARIIAVADSFDLLSSERGQALPLHEVEKGLELRRGRELDPDLVNLFINILRQGKSTADLGKLDNSDLPF